MLIVIISIGFFKMNAFVNAIANSFIPLFAVANSVQSNSILVPIESSYKLYGNLSTVPRICTLNS